MVRHPSQRRCASNSRKLRVVQLRQRGVEYQMKAKSLGKKKPITSSMEFEENKMLKLRNRSIEFNYKVKECPTATAVRISQKTLKLRGRVIAFSDSPSVKQEKIHTARALPPCKLEADEDVECIFRENDLVFARVKGFSEWPARIQQVLKYPASTRRYNRVKKLTKIQKLKRYEYRVKFFGTLDMKRVTGDKLYFYTAENLLRFRENRFRGTIVNSLFAQALEEAAAEYNQ